jgi:ABC-type Mn2+/Zn2+ transport system permease subunit/Mn-dependent DtxR family transcriptional regulator
MNSFLEPLQYAFMQRALIAAVLVGVVCGTLGCYIVLRRMALIGDALAHSVLPGVAIAFIVGADFFIGAAAAGIVTAGVIGWVTSSSRVKEDAAIGVVFTGAFALGIVLITLIQSKSVDLFHMLFGNVLGVEDRDLYITAGITAGVLLTLLLLYKEMLVHAFDPIFAAAIGLPARALHYLLMLLLSLTVVAALQTVGLVLVVAMLITPASTAYLLTDRFARMLGISAGIGVLSSLIGLFGSYHYNVSSGAAIVLVATLFFFVAILFAPERGVVVRRVRAQRAARRTATEDALKQAHALVTEGTPVTAAALGARMGTGAGEARRRIATLRSQGLLTGEALTPEGDRQAHQMIRAHRLWERYLVDEGGVSWTEVHDEAERLEHVEPLAMAEQLDAALGSPRSDPHGEPIPTPEGELEELRGRVLSDLKVGESARIVAVREQTREGLRRLADLGLVPASEVNVTGRENGALLVSTDGERKRVELALADGVLVEEEVPPPTA